MSFINYAEEAVVAEVVEAEEKMGFFKGTVVVVCD